MSPRTALALLDSLIERVDKVQLQCDLQFAHELVSLFETLLNRSDVNHLRSCRALTDLFHFLEKESALTSLPRRLVTQLDFWRCVESGYW